MCISAQVASFPGRWEPEECPTMRAAHGDANNHLIALGEQIINCDVQIRERSVHGADELSHALAAGGKSRRECVSNKGCRHTLIQCSRFFWLNSASINWR